MGFRNGEAQNPLDRTPGLTNVTPQMVEICHRTGGGEGGGPLLKTPRSARFAPFSYMRTCVRVHVLVHRAEPFQRQNPALVRTDCLLWPLWGQGWWFLDLAFGLWFRLHTSPL